MTDPTPLDRDELVAAYLDGEATPAERAQVEADPELMARATILRQVADMVAEPVLAPPPDIKRAHIAAALAASPTAPNVTALATRRKRLDLTKLAAVAAVVIAVLAVPIVLLSGGGDDDDTVATAGSDDTSSAEDAGVTAASGDGAAGDDGGDDGAAVSDELFSDDRAEGESAGAEMAAEEPQSEPEPEPADDGAEEAGDDGSGEEPAADSEADLAVPFARTIGPVDDIEALAAEVLADDGVGDADDGSADGLFIEDLACVTDWFEPGDAILRGAGTAILPAGERTWAQVEDDDGFFFVVFDVTCAVESEYRPG